MHMAPLPILSTCFTFLSILVVYGQFLVPVSATNKFDDFIAAYGRSYQKGSLEYTKRSALFMKRFLQIATHNKQSDKSWTAAVNHLTDWTEEEFAQLRGWRHVGTSSDGGAPAGSEFLQVQISTDKVQQSVEWQGKLASLAANNVYDQGGCGSCWAVASAVMLEARHESQLNATRTFSMQELVSCVPNPDECGGQGGCEGATVELAMKYVTEHGLPTNEAVPYVGSDTPCKTSMLESRQDGWDFMKSQENGGGTLRIAEWQTLPKNKAYPLMLALLDGPVAVAVGALPWGIYDSGVFNSCSKNAVIDHAVVCTGYGRDTMAGKNYWNIRNSWGPNWGEKGHIRLLRQDTFQADDEFCGTDNKPEDGIECKPYPKTVEVCGMCGILYDSVVLKFKKPMAQISTRPTFLHRAI